MARESRFFLAFSLMSFFFFFPMSEISNVQFLLVTECSINISVPTAIITKTSSVLLYSILFCSWLVKTYTKEMILEIDVMKKFT